MIAGAAGEAVLAEHHHLALVVERRDVAAALVAAALAQGVGDVVRVTLVGGCKVDVVGDQELARADDVGAGPRIVRGRAEVGPPVRLRQLVCQPLVFVGPHGGKVPAGRARCSVLVEVHRDAEVADAAAAFPCQRHAVRHGDTGDRHEGADVHRAHARVAAMMLRHVDGFGGAFAGAEGCLDHRLRRADEGDDRAVGVFARIDVEQRHAADSLDLGHDAADHRGIAPFGKIRHAFHQLAHVRLRNAHEVMGC